VWKTIAQENPDALLLLGDNIYLDHNHIGRADPGNVADAHRLANRLREKYEDQFSEPNFRALMVQMGLLVRDEETNRLRLKTPLELKTSPSRIFPIYDDHDFLGNNRCGGDFGNKELRTAARDMFVETFGRRRNPSTALFSVDRRVGGLVDIFILDGRFYRKSDAVPPNDENSMLGSMQWDWLEQKLLVPTTSKYTIVISSTTVHDFGVDNQECWQDHYPHAYQRLVGNLGNRPGTLVVSGDIHKNAFSVEDGIVEIVSSGVATRKGGDDDGEVLSNYGILTFTEEEMQVRLRTRTGEKTFSMPLSSWGSL
jgi:phosphodiesterase/alkaline phosphatase D-like protein